MATAMFFASLASVARALPTESTPIWTMPVAIGAGPSRRCGATTAKGATSWAPYGYDGLQLHVPTSTCNFTSVPQYASSIVGDIDEWGSTGTHTMLRAAAQSFTVIVLHPKLRGTELLDAARQYNWRVSWIGDSGSNTGITLPGKTGWRQGKTKHELVLDVSTSANKYKSTPTYFTSFHGFTNHWRVDGSHAVYSPKRTSFRVYIVYDNEISPNAAEKDKWQISWIGIDSHDPDVGHSDSSWKVSGDGQGLVMNVDATPSKFHYTPTFVSSTTTNYMHWNVYGGGSVYEESRRGFKLFLATTSTKYPVKQSLARFYKWRVSYLGYAGPVSCDTSKWSTWGDCSKKCDGVRTRTRKVVQKQQHGGRGCPALTQQKLHCNLDKCKPQPCRTSNWGVWPTCSRTCGGGITNRARQIIQKPKYGGKKCPPLTDLKPCSTDPCPVDCKVTEWTLWTVCDRRCGRAKQHRSRKVQTKPRYGGAACPALAMSRYCFGTKCIGQGPSQLCGGHTKHAAGANAGITSTPAVIPWRMVGNDAVALTVDTSLCKFSVTPEYVFDIVGLNHCPYFKTFSGSHTVLNSTKSSFVAVVWLPNLQGTQNLDAFAKSYGWVVNWIGDSGSNSGRTVPGRTRWQQREGEESTLFAHIDTSGCEYANTPRYVSMIHGAGDVWRTRGSAVVFQASKTGFTVYVVAHRPITPAEAEQASWTVSWIGFFNGLPTASKDAVAVGHTAVDPSGDYNAIGWHKAPNGGGIFLNVARQRQNKGITKAVGKHTHGVEMVYVAALAIPFTTNWELPGSISINNPTKSGFQLYLGNMNDGGVKFPDEMHWGVAFVEFSLVHCVMSRWSPYSTCTHTCGGGTQQRSRKILQAARRGGKPCPTQLHESRACNTKNCVGSGKFRMCGSTTSRSGTPWTVHGEHGLTVSVSTSFCQFQGQVAYAVTIVGDAEHWDLAGSNTIVDQSRSSLRMIVSHPRRSATALLHAARTHGWRVSWLGATGKEVGVTNLARTGWKRPKSNLWAKSAHMPSFNLTRILSVDVDTSESDFGDRTKHYTPPRYFPALLGFTNQWRTQGSHVVINPTRKSFRINVLYDSLITPAQAEAFKWRVSWIGVSDNQRSGTSKGTWTTIRSSPMATSSSGASAVKLHVDTSSRNFHVNPTYVVSLEALDGPWMVSGLATVYDPAKTGFNVYASSASHLGPPRAAKLKAKHFWDPARYAHAHKWRVNYVGYIGQSHVCGATTPPGATAWQKFGSLGLYIDIDTSYCQFKHAPQYMATVMGVNRSPFFGYMRGTIVLQSASATRFRAIIYYPALSGYNLLDYSKTYKWHIGWLADTGSSSGATLPGKTGWKVARSSDMAAAPSLHKGAASHSTILYTDVDTTKWKFVTTPRYFTMLRGARQHAHTQGSNVVFAPTPGGFRVYVAYSGTKQISAAQAEDWQWSVSWMADTETYSGTSALSARWSPSKSGQGIYMDIDTGENGFKVCPTYIVSPWQVSPIWDVSALQSVDVSVDQATYTSLRIFLDMSDVKFVQKHDWRVNYVGYEVIDCHVSNWQKWSKCSKTCGGGQMVRKRKILQYPEKGGRPCPAMLKQSKDCNPNDCSTCRTTKWSQWSKCDCKRGRLAVQNRKREDIGPVPGMHACVIPDLTSSRPCYREVCLRTTTTRPTTTTTTTAAATSAPRAQNHRIRNPHFQVQQTLTLFGYTLESFGLAQKRTFVSALASVVGVNSRDVIVTSMANGGGDSAGAKHWLQMRLRINQVRARLRPRSDAFVAAHTDTFPLSAILFAIKATRAKSQAMTFFMKSGDYEQLVRAQLHNLGLSLASGVKPFPPSILPIVARDKVAHRIATQSSHSPSARSVQQSASTSSETNPGAAAVAAKLRRSLLIALAVLSVVYAAFGAKMLVQRLNATADSGVALAGVSRISGGGASGTTSEQMPLATTAQQSQQPPPDELDGI